MKPLLFPPSAKRVLVAFMTLGFLLTAPPALTSETRIGAREVYPVPFSTEADTLTDSSTSERQYAFLPVLSELVFLKTAVTEPLLRSSSPEQADSVIRTELSADGREVSILLAHGTEEIERVAGSLPPGGLGFAEVEQLVSEAAAIFVPHLGPLERPLAEAEIVQRTRREEVEQILSLEDRLDSRFLFTLWVSEIRAVRYKVSQDSGASSGETDLVFSPFPLVAELTYFGSPHFGLLTRMSVDFNSNTPFYEWRLAAAEGDPMQSGWDQTDNMILLPGVGLNYRSLGRVGIDFSFFYSIGVARVTAREDVSLYESYDQQESPDDFLAKGESIWFMYQSLSFQPGLTLAITDRWAMRAATSFSFDPSGLARTLPYSDAAGVAFRYLQLGLARRF